MTKNIILKSVAKPRVVLFDETPLSRESLSKLIENSEFDVIAMSDAANFQYLSSAKIAIVNLKNGRVSEPEAHTLISSIQKYAPEVPIFIISEQNGSCDSSLNAIAAGVQGYFVATEGTRLLIAALRLVMEGGLYISPDVVRECTARLIPHS